MLHIEMENPNKPERYEQLYLDIAQRLSEMSHCERNKVGCILVRQGRILSMGWNGMPSGFDNTCEEHNRTKPEVIHAEENAIAKIACSTDSSAGSTLYTTLAPCVECAKLVIQSKVVKVVYNNRYRYDAGIDLLNHAGVEVVSYEPQGR